MVSSRENENDLDPAEILEGHEMARIESMSAIESITRGEVDMQVATAKRFPRSLKTFKQRALTMATLDQKTAESCFYVLPRDGKTIEGPSVRLAEIVASEWGNLRAEYRVLGEDEKFITAQATCWDMERNLLVRCEVRRRISGKGGRRFSDDMIVVTGNAAGKIAFRNAVFSVVPRAFVDDIYRQARKVALGDARTLTQQRTEWFTYWSKNGISEAQVLGMLGKPGVADVDLEDLAKMKGLSTAIKDGDTTLDDAFPPEPLKEGTHGFGFKKAQAESPQPPAEDNAPPHDEESPTKSRESRKTRTPAEEKWLADKQAEAKASMRDPGQD